MGTEWFVSVWVVSSHDCVGHLRDLTFQYHQIVLHHVFLAWEKNQNSKYNYC